MKKLIIAALFLTSTVLMGQGVLGVGNFIHVVANLDRSIEFYHDGLGLEMTGAPGPRAFSANAVVSSLYDAPGAQSRVASFKIPESNMAVEIVEFQGLNATPVQPRFFDPGAITLTLVVEDLEATKTRLNRLKGLEWVSAQNSGVVVRDPDGIFVELEQARRDPPWWGCSGRPEGAARGHGGGSRQDDAVLWGSARIHGRRLAGTGNCGITGSGRCISSGLQSPQGCRPEAGALGHSRSGVGRAADSRRRFRRGGEGSHGGGGDGCIGGRTAGEFGTEPRGDPAR